VSARACPDWHELLELSPDLQFKHYTVTEAQLPADALMAMRGISVNDATICCDRERHVYNARHTDESVAQALRDTHWYELGEWSTTGPGGAE
jgi:hypothetical protein